MGKTMEFRDPVDVHAPVASYSHQAEVDPGSRWLVISGQIGMRSDSSMPDAAGEQLAVALDNVGRNLVAAGMAIDDLVKLTIYLTDDLPGDERRSLLAAFLHEHRPTMTLLRVAGLASPMLKVEVEAWAACKR